LVVGEKKNGHRKSDFGSKEFQRSSWSAATCNEVEMSPCHAPKISHYNELMRRPD
jgi:hypothetical protein